MTQVYLTQKGKEYAESDGPIQNDLIQSTIESGVLIWFVTRMVDLKHSIWFTIQYNIILLRKLSERNFNKVESYRR